MKEVVSISLGSSKGDYEFTTEFLGEEFRIRRFGADGSEERAKSLLQQWQNEADAMGLGMVPDHEIVGTRSFVDPFTQKLENTVTKVPVTTGAHLRRVLQRWAVRHTQIELDQYFNNARVFFTSGMLNYDMAAVMSEFTENLSFGDPILQLGTPKILTSLHALELYAAGTHKFRRWSPTKTLANGVAPIKEWNQYILRKAIQKATVLVGPYEHWVHHTPEELAGKTIITSTLSDEKVEVLRNKGVNLAIDVCPQVFDRVVGLNVLEAMIGLAFEKNPHQISNDNYLEIMRDYQMEPRFLYPSGDFRRIRRFAFVFHPLSQEYFKKVKPMEILSKVSPPGVMNTVEKAMAHMPPIVYSKVTGIKSPQGVEAEGWYLSIGGTPKEMLARSPEFTYRRLLAASRMAERLGAQIMGLGAFTKVVGDAGVTVAKRSRIPVTTGNSYSASGALWAAAEATRRLGLVEMHKGQKTRAKSMVVGATGAIGAVSSRLLAKATEEVHLVAPRPDKLMELKKLIEQETPEAKVFIATNPDESLADMDMIVTTTSGAGKKVLDIMKVKPGCVITDVARPLDLSPSDVAKRPDVLVIESGEIELPGNVRSRDVGLPGANIAFACIAETIVLALEGRFESFTVGREIEWEKVKEIYQMGLKHGMKLAAISGVNGVFTDEDIARVRELALAARKSKVAEEA